MELINTLTNSVKRIMNSFAVWLNKISKGKIKPAYITYLSLLGHIPIALLLIDNQPVVASIFLVFFGLLDSLDGALARAQKTASLSGMFLDAVTDRLKEVILYSALAIYVVNNYPESNAWLVVALAGTSLLVSYVKAKGEMAISAKSINKQSLNRLFSSGIARYEIRMALIIFGLVTGLILPIIKLTVAINLLTFSIRFNQILLALKSSE